MTEAQRDYIADLAARKGVRLADMDNRSASWASAKIEELKAMPDKAFDTVTAALENKLVAKTNAVINEVSKWNFQA